MGSLQRQVAFFFTFLDIGTKVIKVGSVKSKILFSQDTLVSLYYIFPLISLYRMADTAFVTIHTVGQDLLRSPIQNVTLCVLVTAWVAVEAASEMQYMTQQQQTYPV